MSCPARRLKSSGCRRRDDVLLEMLVGRAVLAARQRNTLTRRALTGARVTRQRRAVEAYSLLLAPVDVLGRYGHVAVDRAVHAHLARHREIEPDGVEQSARGAREIVAVRRHATE